MEVFKNHEAVEVASCESGLKHYSNGTTTRGFINPKDVGVFQINLYYHEEQAKKMDLNLLKPEDNIQYAKYLYDKNGWRDWAWSKPCHGN